MTVTRNGKPIFTIVPVLDGVVTGGKEVLDRADGGYTGGENVPEWARGITSVKPEIEESLGRCEVVVGCNREGVGMGKIWNEVIGEFVEAVACEKHLKKSQEEG